MRETTGTASATRSRHVGWLGLSAWLAWSCAQPSAAGAQPSTTATQPSATAPQPSTTAPQPSATAPQPSATATQPSGTATQPLAARKPAAQSGLSRNYVWFTASASLLSVSLAGLFALRVHSLYDQAIALPGVSPERLVLRRQTERAEVTADCLFASAAAFALSSVILVLFTDWDRPSERPTRAHAALQLVPIAERGGARLVLRGVLP
jgi:hypothetical protein